MSEADFKLMNDMAYWLEGVIQTGKQLNMFNKIVMIDFLRPYMFMVIIKITYQLF